MWHPEAGYGDLGLWRPSGGASDQVETHSFQCEEVLLGKTVGNHIVIIGGGVVGCGQPSFCFSREDGDDRGDARYACGQDGRNHTVHTDGPFEGTRTENLYGVRLP